MKYVLVFALIALVFWFWRSQRLRGKNRQARENENNMKNARNINPLTPADEIAPCSVCQLHLPRKDLLRGHSGLYCSEAHRQLAGD